MSDAASSNSNNDQFSSNLEPDDKERSKLDVNMHIISALFNKIIKSIENFCNIYINNKHARIIKYKAMTPIV